MSSWNSWLSFFDWYLLNRHHPKLLCATESLKAHLHKLDFFPPHQCLISQNAEETVMRSHVCTRSKVLQWTLWSVLYSRVNTPPQCFIYCRCFSCETKQQWQTRRTKCRMPESERIWRDDTIGHTSPLCIYAKLNTCSVTTLILQQNPSKMAQKYTQTASIRRTDVHYLTLLKYYQVAVVFF